MDREGFRSRLKQYKEAKGFDPLLKYWEWKQKYDSAPQPDNIPSQPQPDLPTVAPQPLNDRAHRWDNEHYVDPVNIVFDADRYRSWKEPALKTFGKRVKFTYRDFMKPADVKYMKFLQSIGRLGNTLKGASIFSEAVQQLFPSEEVEAIESLRVNMQKQNDYLTGKDIPKYDEGTERVGEPGLWDRFTNTVSVLYNNAARKVKKFFENETTGEVIDLSNQQVSRITPDTKNLTAIYGNEFVENNANNIRTRKQFEETTDTLIGDRKIPLSKINNFYGIENGKLKAGDISIFDENTTVIPNRAKKTGKIKEIIFSPVSKHDIDSLRAVINLERLIKKDKLKKLADSLNVDYGSNAFTQMPILYGSPSYNLSKRYRKALANGLDSEFVKMYQDAIKPSARQVSAMNSLRIGNTSYVTESNDTINFQNTAMPAHNKTMYADEYGNAMFINNTNYLSKEQLRLVNEKLKITPMYPILIDNGRYLHYLTDSPNYTTYTSYDFARDPKNMYVIGTIK